MWWRVASGVLVALAGCKSCKDKDASKPVTVSAITATVTAPSTPVPFAEDALANLPIKIGLSNASDKPITVSAFTTGNITVKSVACDGVSVAGARIVTGSFAPPSVYAANSLKTVAPKASLALEMEGVISVSEKDGTLTTLYFPIPKPGACRVTLTYEYRGPDSGHADLVRGPFDLPAFLVVFQ